MLKTQKNVDIKWPLILLKLVGFEARRDVVVGTVTNYGPPSICTEIYLNCMYELNQVLENRLSFFSKST